MKGGEGMGFELFNFLGTISNLYIEMSACGYMLRMANNLISK